MAALSGLYLHMLQNQDRCLCEEDKGGKRPCFSSASLGRRYKNTLRKLQSFTDFWNQKCTCSQSFWKFHISTRTKTASVEEALPGKRLQASVQTGPDWPGWWMLCSSHEDGSGQTMWCWHKLWTRLATSSAQTNRERTRAPSLKFIFYRWVVEKKINWTW